MKATTLLFSLILIFSSSSGCLAGDYGADWSDVTFLAIDTSNEVSNGTSDELVKISWATGNEDFGWDVTNITIMVGDEVFRCTTDYSTECYIKQLGEVVNEHSRQIWAADESVILVEYKVDICSQECDLVVAVTSEDIIIPGTPVVNVK